MGLKNTAHCDLCDIDWNLDLEEQLEVTFTVNPNIRKIEYKDWSERMDFGSKMEFLDDILARENRKFTVGECVFPDKPLEASGDFAPGLYYYYMPAHVELGGYLEVSETPSPKGEDNFSITVSREGEMLEKKLSAGSGRINFTVTSNYPSMNGFLVTPVAPRANWVSAAYVTAQQDFRDLFSGEFLTPGLSFAVKNTTLMFTDITGSTALYEAIGDAGAYSAVHDHFGVMIEIIRKYEGGIVKTIGDAVMAAFPVNANAVRAACEIQRLFSSGAVRSGDIKIKIGLHRGPAIAVTSNRNLDFFGRSVNIAARVQGKSAENEVLFTQPVVSDPEVERYFIENKFKPEERPVSLKGIAEPLRVYSLKF
jgi:class 3 adenylate cyclase